MIVRKSTILHQSIQSSDNHASIGPLERKKRTLSDTTKMVLFFWLCLATLFMAYIKPIFFLFEAMVGLPKNQ